ncbi:MAG: NAD-dependent deacylase [Hyphomicrobium sp.]|uniref:NAD-dependent deacylase n=1 Tax=Hyphomicrobium sp. TaxID=82 RepID=UPI001327470C|nr:NAD-dependent deacylase [Hyphomicrobium sp.]KAB2940091.1 MAG: NAD-dependent deacylase [Hyphomicrobium sp.]MBZ0208278.1 NAD-dependent deacylase [Hyphomicrobium sp.]
MARFSNVVVLTGAGLSAESGLSTFRDKNGIWAKYDYRDVATPEGFRANPQLVHDFYNSRRRAHAGVKPNAAHLALARLEREHAGSVTIVTQNIDALHEAAGSRNLIHMHGELLKALCALCGERQAWTDDLSVETPCPACSHKGGMRPDVVWFGEMPYEMERIYEVLTSAHLFISIGTSGNVYPAAGFVATTREAGAHTVELNLEPSESAHLFDETLHGPATQIVPAYINRLLSR